MDGVNPNPVNPISNITALNDEKKPVDANQVLLDKARTGLDKSGAALDKVALIIEKNTQTALDLLV